MLFSDLYSLKDKELQVDDVVIILKAPLKVRKGVGYYLDNPNAWNKQNHEIFKKLSIADPYYYIKNIVGYEPHSGGFPELNTLEDLKKVVIVLFKRAYFLPIFKEGDIVKIIDNSYQDSRFIPLSRLGATRTIKQRILKQDRWLYLVEEDSDLYQEFWFQEAYEKYNKQEISLKSEEATSSKKIDTEPWICPIEEVHIDSKLATIAKAEPPIIYSKYTTISKYSVESSFHEVILQKQNKTKKYKI